MGHPYIEHSLIILKMKNRKIFRFCQAAEIDLHLLA